MRGGKTRMKADDSDLREPAVRSQNVSQNVVHW
jgi:hypothetical protein